MPDTDAIMTGAVADLMMRCVDGRLIPGQLVFGFSRAGFGSGKDTDDSPFRFLFGKLPSQESDLRSRFNLLMAEVPQPGVRDDPLFGDRTRRPPEDSSEDEPEADLDSLFGDDDEEDSDSVASLFGDDDDEPASDTAEEDDLLEEVFGDDDEDTTEEEDDLFEDVFGDDDEDNAAEDEDAAIEEDDIGELEQDDLFEDAFGDDDEEITEEETLGEADGDVASVDDAEAAPAETEDEAETPEQRRRRLAALDDEADEEAATAPTAAPAPAPTAVHAPSQDSILPTDPNYLSLFEDDLSISRDAE